MKYFLAYLLAFYLARPAQADRLSVDAKQRSCILDGAGPKPKPLIIALHGGGGSARQFRRQSGIETAALAKGFAVVWPDAIGGNWNDGRLNRRRQLVHDENDQGFIRALVKKLVADGVADAKRIYVTGMSNGGIMSFRLACDNLDLFVGAAPVAANMEVPAGCNGTSPLALFNIVGTDDTFVPIAGEAILGRAGQGQVISSAETLVLFQPLANCRGVPKVTAIERAPDDGTSLYISEAQGCAAPITQVQVVAGGHAWPGKNSPIDWITGVNSREINATTALVDFFAGLESQP